MSAVELVLRVPHPVEPEPREWVHVLDGGERAYPRMLGAIEASTWSRRWILDLAGRLVARLAEAIGRAIASARFRRGSRPGAPSR